MSNHYLKMVLDDGFQGPHATARNRGIHDVISLLEGAGE